MTATRSQQDPDEPGSLRVSLSAAEKVMGLVLALAAIVGPSIVTYVRGDFRLAAVEKQSAETAAIVSVEQQLGHERRLTKVEARQDEADKAAVVIDKKVDRALTILERIDRTVGK